MRSASVLVVTSLVLAAAANVASAEEFVRIDASVVRMRSGPGNGREVTGLAREGQILEVISRSRGWVRVEAGGQKAWVDGDHVSSVDAEVGRVTANGGLRVRTGPGTRHQVVGVLPENARVVALERQGSWRKIAYEDSTGWVHGAYVAMQPRDDEGSSRSGAGSALARAFGDDSGVTAEPAQPSSTGGDSSTSAASIPSRSSGALGGQAFLDQTAGLSSAQREDRILRALAQGNVPAFLRRFREVRLSATLDDGRRIEGSVWVSVDYFAVGNDDDFVRVPMNPLTAQRVADRFDCALPTRKLVNAIWSAADVKLDPIPLTPGPQMTSNAYTRTHDARIRAQLGGSPSGRLIAGHKKDVVVSNRLLTRPNRVAIYGWHRRSGQPIQPLSTVHENTYADYSHGVRLVKQRVIVDGRPMRLADALQDPDLWRLFSDEGRMPSPRVPGA